MKYEVRTSRSRCDLCEEEHETTFVFEELPGSRKEVNVYCRHCLQEEIEKTRCHVCGRKMFIFRFYCGECLCPRCADDYRLGYEFETLNDCENGFRIEE